MENGRDNSQFSILHSQFVKLALRVLRPLLVWGGIAGLPLLIGTWLPRLLGEASQYYLDIAVLMLIYIVEAVGLNIVNGFCGQFSIGHAAFMAIGAYGSAAITLFGGSVLREALLPFLSKGVGDTVVFGLATLSGGCLAAVFGLLVGLPTLRLRGDYLAIATLGFNEIVRILLLNIEKMGGAAGLSGIPHRTTISAALLVAVLTIALSRNLRLSAYGRNLIAIRENEVAAQAIGIDTTRHKVLAFMLAAFFAGIGGGLFAHYYTSINPRSFDWIQSVMFILMVVLGGSGSITGAVLGAAIVTLIPQLLRTAPETFAAIPWLANMLRNNMVIFSALLIIIMLTRREGIVGTRELSWRGTVRALDRMATALGRLVTGRRDGGSPS